ncbi:isoleucine--tRNA ligase [Clostridia bacterium]|nr:isoleucine--tRNA ligase [Clostridia bacterium]
MYQKVDATLNFTEREKQIGSFWKENQIFEKSMEQRKDCETYTFYDGPPTANGKPHIGHVLTRVIKDMIPRYQTMKGKYVPRKAGWDTHGLPVELEVEKELGINGKDQIEAYGLEPFIKKCKESVWKYKHMWEDFSETVGFWADMDKPYVTYENDFIESEWWALKRIWEKGLLYKGFKIVPYCPRCGTPLSAQEVSLGYKDVKERSAIAKFPVKGEDAYILAWTTTPWTLPSNVALCVNPKEIYAKVKAADGNVYYMAEALLDTVLGSLAKKEEDGSISEKAYEILEHYPGRDLEYKEYEALFGFTDEAAFRLGKKAHYVTCDEYVTLSDGTGVVHTAPAFGEDDARVGRQYDLPFLQLVDSKGEMTKETPYAGTFCKDADPLILKDLKIKGLLFSAPPFEHSYPFCWRCDTPLIYYARESWFIKMTAVKEEMIANNNTIHWIPENIGVGRFGNWLENLQDWGISRNRYWGTPLNIWECACGHQHSIGSIEELKSLSKNCPEGIELHRPYIDEVTIACEKCGGQMKRVPEVVDCWFDSGAMPFAQHHYPFENKDLFEAQFPAQFISEAVDQTRGWFYALLAESTLLFDKSSYENVIVLGHVQDENGQKMSKSKGNAIDPFDALNTYGADAIRWYFYVNSAPWLPNRFHGKAVQEGQRKFLSTLWNTYAFFVLYANIDGFDASKYSLATDKLSVMDRWLLSKLNTLVQEVDEFLSDYRITETARALQAFTDELSNWYVRRCRERFWAKGMEQDKINAYMSLHTALVTLSKIAAPMIPFMTEEIYRNLVVSIDKSARQSVHLCDFPKADVFLIDTEIEVQMDTVLKLVSLGRAARNTANRKIRQPLAKMYVKIDGASKAAKAERSKVAVKIDSLDGEARAERSSEGTKENPTLPKLYQNIIEEELNVKELILTEEVASFTSYSFKPQLRTVGPKYGKYLKQIQQALTALDGNAAMEQLKQEGAIRLTQISDEVVLTEEDLLIATAQTEGYVSESDGSLTVVLDTTLTPDLIEEGYVRELVSKLQTMRKEAGFEVMDRIAVGYQAGEAICAVCQKHKERICSEVLSQSIEQQELEGYQKEWDINGEQVKLIVTKSHRD